MNYHLEHHAMPGVPFYLLPQAHRFLDDADFFEGHEGNVSTSFVATARTFSKP